MAWYVSVFLAVVALCAVIYAALGLRSLFAKPRSTEAMVFRRYREEFPMTVGFVRRSRKERYLEFITEEGRKLTLAAGEELYEQCPAGTKGTLIWQGNILVSFEPRNVPGK